MTPAAVVSAVRLVGVANPGRRGYRLPKPGAKGVRRYL
jgi:hypothetical protein